MHKGATDARIPDYAALGGPCVGNYRRILRPIGGGKETSISSGVCIGQCMGIPRPGCDHLSLVRTPPRVSNER